MQPLSTPKFAPLPTAQWQAPTVADKAAIVDKQVDEFSALLYAQMFRQMRESAESEDGQGFFGSGDSYLFADFFDRQIGATFANSDGGALRESLRRQLATALETQHGAKGGSQ